ncbi:InlB B-repeat-containing protein [Candidatus Saccharibacteria bacterium]|nr:InlB B-repeat-containing protein [Candidatus Saccharibacteria bacterium]
MKNKRISPALLILPLVLVAAVVFLLNVNAKGSAMPDPIDITTYASRGLITFNAENCGSYLCNQLEGFTTTGDGLVFYTIPDEFQDDNYTFGNLSGYTGASFTTPISGIPFSRSYEHGNDMTYNTKTDKILVVGPNGSHDAAVLNSSTLAQESVINLPRGASAIAYDEFNDNYIMRVSKDSIHQFWFYDSSFNRLSEVDAIPEQIGQHDGNDNIDQGADFHNGYIYSTFDNYDGSTGGEVAYINVYKAKLKTDGTPDRGFGSLVAVYYIDALNLGEIESISFRNNKAYLGFSNGSTRGNVSKFTSFNQSHIEQALPQPSISYVDGKSSTTVKVTSNDVQLKPKSSNWVLSDDGYTISRTVNSGSISGSDVSICDNYNNCTTVNYDHTNTSFETTYTLSFNANSGTGSVSSQQCSTAGSSCTVIIPDEKPSKNGYYFLGWSEDSAATEATYYPGQSTSLSSNKTLYAVWQENVIPPEPDPAPEGTGEITWIQDQTHTKEDKKNLIIRIDYNVDSFVALKIDNAEVSNEYYTAIAGSTVISIDYNYIDTLTTGDHTIAAIFTRDTIVNTTFTVEEAHVDPTPEPEPTPSPEPTPEPDDDEDILVPDTGGAPGINNNGSYGGYLVGISAIVVFAVVLGYIIRKINVHRRIEF